MKGCCAAEARCVHSLSFFLFCINREFIKLKTQQIHLHEWSHVLSDRVQANAFLFLLHSQLTLMGTLSFLLCRAARLRSGVRSFRGCIHSECVPSIMQSLMDYTGGRGCIATESTTATTTNPPFPLNPSVSTMDSFSGHHTGTHKQINTRTHLRVCFFPSLYYSSFATSPRQHSQRCQ